jgi:hypothetical protein
MITRDDWLAAMEAAQAAPPENDPDVMTLNELRDLLDCSRSTTERLVRQLMDAGKAERTFKSIRQINGTWRRIPAYRLLKPGHDNHHGQAK